MASLFSRRDLRPAGLKAYCHVNFRALQEPPVSAGSGNVGCGCPGFDSFHSVISDSQGGAASGWNGKTISDSGMN